MGILISKGVLIDIFRLTTQEGTYLKGGTGEHLWYNVGVQSVLMGFNLITIIFPTQHNDQCMTLKGIKHQYF